jgi:hypothetical protein
MFCGKALRQVIIYIFYGVAGENFAFRTYNIISNPHFRQVLIFDCNDSVESSLCLDSTHTHTHTQRVYFVLWFISLVAWSSRINRTANIENGSE